MSQPKGRATPKRSEAQRRRGAPTPPPRNRKEAAARARAANREARATQQEALRAGDERNMPELHRGAEKQAVRDAVDSRLTLGWLAIPAFVMNISVFAVANQSLLWLKGLLAYMSMLLMVVVVVDGLRTYRRIRRVLDARFPKGTSEARSQLVRYGLARGFQRRRRRLPPPRTQIGDTVT